MEISFDFRDLSRDDQAKVIQNTIDRHGMEYLAYLIVAGDYDIFGWFNLDKSNEGADYWFNLKKEIYNEEV